MQTDPLSLKEYSHLVSLIFDAALDPTRWNYFLQHIHQYLDGVRAQMYGYDLQSNMHLELETYGYDESFMASYKEYYSTINCWASGLATTPAGVVIPAQQICREEDLLKTEFYADWVRPQEDLRISGGAILMRDHSRIFLIGGNIRAKDGEYAQIRWLKTVELLMPHLQQAFEMSRALAAKVIQETAHTLHNADSAASVLVVGADGRLHYANDAAKTALERGHVMTVNISGTLCFRDANAGDRLKSALNAAAETTGIATHAFPVSDALGRQTVLCRTARLSERIETKMLFGSLISPNAPTILLSLTPLNAPISRHAEMRANFGLTAAEGKIALHIAEGLAPKDIAETRNVSIQTVRTQLKTVMSKMGVNRQAEIVRLIQHWS